MKCKYDNFFFLFKPVKKVQDKIKYLWAHFKKLILYVGLFIFAFVLLYNLKTNKKHAFKEHKREESMIFNFIFTGAYMFFVFFYQNPFCCVWLYQKA
jgi:hypothetical protein